MTLNMFVKGAFPEILQSPINAGAFCMLAGFIIVPVVSLFTKKPDKEMVEEAFDSYKRLVTVEQSSALSDEAIK